VARPPVTACRHWVTNGRADNMSGMSEPPQPADPLCATPKSAALNDFRTFCALPDWFDRAPASAGLRCYASYPWLCSGTSVWFSVVPEFCSRSLGSSAFAAGQVRRHTRPEGA
jgi:hypothetical protein